MNILQLNPPIPVTTPLGDGISIIIIDYGIEYNTAWIVALTKDGQIKHFESNDVKIEKNYTFNIGT